MQPRARRGGQPRTRQGAQSELSREDRMSTQSTQRPGHVAAPSLGFLSLRNERAGRAGGSGLLGVAWGLRESSLQGRA